MIVGINMTEVRNKMKMKNKITNDKLDLLKYELNERPGLLSRLRNSKPGKCLATGLGIGFGAFGVGVGYNMINPESAYCEEISSSEKAYQIFDRIMQLDSKSKNPVQRELMINEGARTLVYVLADKLGNNDGQSTPDEARKALKYLMDTNGAFGKVADKYAGNGDGVVTPKELKNLGSKLAKFPGLKTVVNMWQ